MERLGKGQVGEWQIEEVEDYHDDEEEEVEEGVGRSLCNWAAVAVSMSVGVSERRMNSWRKMVVGDGAK